MPEYEIIEWNLEKFPANSVPWVQDAVACKKWAYAADYIRLYALYNYGGIYLDMDVCVYKSFDPFLSHRAFSCVEFDPRPSIQQFTKEKSSDAVLKQPLLELKKGIPGSKHVLTIIKINILLIIPIFILIM